MNLGKSVRIYDNKLGKYVIDEKSVSLKDTKGEKLLQKKTEEVVPLLEYLETTKALEKNNRFDVIYSTGILDASNFEIFEGSWVEPIRKTPAVKEMGIPETTTSNGEIFQVLPGNYVFGKWVARKVSNVGFGVEDYYFGNELRLIPRTSEKLEGIIK